MIRWSPKSSQHRSGIKNYHFGAQHFPKMVQNQANIALGTKMSYFGAQHNLKIKPTSIQAVQNPKGFKNELVWSSECS